MYFLLNLPWVSFGSFALYIYWIIGLGYLLNGDYFPIPKGAEIVIEAPNAPINNSPLNDPSQFKRDNREPAAWRHIGLGKRSPNAWRNIGNPT